jgi:hypothetical protein
MSNVAIVSLALAQMSAAPIPSVLPNVAHISAGNAAGVLQYCVSKSLVSSTSASLVMDGLTKKPDVTKSPDYVAGASGEIRGDKNFAIGSAPSFLQSQACDMVLDQAKHL